MKFTSYKTKYKLTIKKQMILTKESSILSKIFSLWKKYKKTLNSKIKITKIRLEILQFNCKISNNKINKQSP
jgi:hypothetical protein